MKIKNKNRKKNEIKAGTMLSYIQMFFGIFIGVLYTPIMIRLLGTSEYGLYNTASSTISMLSILSLGFNSSYIRYYARYKNKNDISSIYKLNGLFLIIFTVTGIIALSCGLILSENLSLVFKNGLSIKEYDVAKKLMILLTINLAISFPMSVFASIISAHERFIILKLLGILKTVIGPLVTMPILLMGYKSVAMVGVTVIISLITDISYFIYVIVILHQKFWFKGIECVIFKDIVIYTAFIAINIIVDQVNMNVDKLLLTRYKGTTAVAIYSVGFSLHTYYQMFSTSIATVFTPRVHILCCDKSMPLQEKMRSINELFVKVGRVQYLVLAAIASGLVFFGKEFIFHWAGVGYEDSYYVAIILIIAITIPLIQNLGIEIQRAQNKHQFRSIAYVIMAFTNLLISIYLCQLYGPIGSTIGTALSYVLANGIIMNIYYYKKCHLDTIFFWKNILSVSKGLIIPVFAGILIKTFFDINSLIQLLVFIGIYVYVYFISMWLFGMNEYEKQLVLSILKKIRKS